jgi:hypothetical protein
MITDPSFSCLTRALEHIMNNRYFKVRVFAKHPSSERCH